MQRYILFFFLFNFRICTPQNVQDAIVGFAKHPFNEAASISFMAIDLDSDSIIASFNKEKLLVSASTTKLFTTASAFEILGKNYSPVTKIYSDGPIDENGVVHGNIWIKGAGDVSMGSKYFNNLGHEMDFLTAWADSLVDMGIKAVDGAIISDGSLFGYEGPPIGWETDDLGNYFGAFHSGINFYDNTIKLNFDSGKKGTKSTLKSVYPVVEGLVMKCNVKASSTSRDNCNIYGVPFSLNRMAIGEIPANRGSFEVKGSMPDPEYQLAKEWTTILLQKGTKVGNGAKCFRLLSPNSKNNYGDTFKLLFSHTGKSVNDIAFWTNSKSVNLFAEALLNYLGYAKLGNGTTTASIGILKNYLSNKISIDDIVLSDGSGLSRNNYISANHFCNLLSYMYSSSNYPIFLATLPIAGQTGTIKNLCKGQLGEGRIFAKSGTLNNVKSYAGYVKALSGKNIAFSFCVNNFSGTSSQIVLKMEDVLNAMVNY